MMGTIEQKRAADALAIITRVKESNNYGKYPSYVDGLPASIVMNGLGQACATLLAQARNVTNDPHAKLYEHLQQWLCRDEDIAPYPNQPSLIRAIANGSQQDYVRAQSEALAYLVWLKKFSQAYLKTRSEE